MCIPEIMHGDLYIYIKQMIMFNSYSSFSTCFVRVLLIVYQMMHGGGKVSMVTASPWSLVSPGSPAHTSG